MVKFVTIKNGKRGGKEMPYESELVEVGEIKELLDVINEEHYELISITSIPENQQLLVICKKPEVARSFLKDRKVKDEEASERE